MIRLLKELRWRGNIYVALVYRLLLAMILFSVCRLAFYLFNTGYFPDMTLERYLRMAGGGLRFDLTAVLYINALVILLMIVPLQARFQSWYERVVRYVFLVTNGAALAMNVADFVYFRFTQRRTTADVMQQFENETNLSGLFFQFIIDYWYAVVFWLALVLLMGWLYRLVKVQGPTLTNRFAFYGFGVLAMPLILYLFAGGVRGGFRHSTRPITLSNAAKYVEDPRDVNIVLNTPFAVFRTLGKTKIKKINYFATDDEAAGIYSPVHTPRDTAAFQKQNVVVIILESFSREFTGFYNRDKNNGAYTGYTPFLDSLIAQGRTFEYTFANGRKSIDGLPSVLTSIPSLGVPHVLTPFANNKVNSLGSLLGAEGYHTSFFHGAPNGSMGFDAFVNMAGFEHYYGMTEYDNDADFDGMWGVWDEPFLKFYGEKLNAFPQPFVSAFFSVSSHHPFRVPEKYEGRFKGGEQPILKCIQYTDYALQQFFKQVSTMPWYNNTLFVITADHISSNTIFPETRTAWGSFSVPIVFFKPDGSLKGVDSTLVQHIDIMPSVLGLLHYEKPYVSFGRDAFRDSTEAFAFNYSDGYNLLQENYLLQFDGKRTVALYDFKSDPMMKHDLQKQVPEVRKRMEMRIKAIIQQYNNRMVDNRLTLEAGR